MFLYLFTDAFVFFFFFKQKTAYEMAQCDWSSDVCSSDLFPSTINPVTSNGAAPKIICQPAIIEGASWITRALSKTLENAAQAAPNTMPSPPQNAIKPLKP